jgi:hypothetical protein
MVEERFAAELAFYRQNVFAWIASGWEHRWVVVKGSHALGPFDIPDAAWRAAIAAWGRPGFLMRRVERDEEPVVASRLCLRPEAHGSS